MGSAPIARLESHSPRSRAVKPLPAQLIDHCTVCLEEQLFSQAFALLSSTLSSGVSNERPCYIPTADILALASTIVVHPGLTTRTLSTEKHLASRDALLYLQTINQCTTPRKAGLPQAFRFKTELSSSRSKRVQSRRSEHVIDDDEALQVLRSPYSGSQSIWECAEDFWHIIGWALNTSITCKRRWKRWRSWLDWMLTVLEQDLDDGGDDPEETMMAHFLSSVGDGRNNRRRLMRAILADGSQKSLAEFGEIWRSETKPPKRSGDGRSRKKRKLDLENGEFGDYYDNESEAESPYTSAPRSRSRTAPSSPAQDPNSFDANETAEAGDEEENTEDNIIVQMTSSAPVSSFGDWDSIVLRQRLLNVLARFCRTYPHHFLDTESLLDLFTEFLRPLPLQIFQQFVLPITPYLDVHTHTLLNQMLLRPLLAATAPRYNETALTPEQFATHFAPYAANGSSSVDNARVSLLVESLLRDLLLERNLDAPPDMRLAVSAGVKARKMKAANDGRRRVGFKVKEETEAASVLRCSADRMTAVLSFSS